MIYLDHAAATPLDPAVVAAMQPFFSDQFFNPSATYLPAQQVRIALEKARSDVAACLGAKNSEIIFTAGGTEADNLAIAGVMQEFPGANVVVSAIEHDAVLQPAQQFDHSIAAVTDQGVVDLANLEAEINDQTVLVSIMYVNNEVGTIQPLRQIATLIKKVRDERRRTGNTLPLYFHTDACQAANYLDLQVSRLGVDLMTLNGGKIYGPKQSGALYVSSKVHLQPIIRGGGQERNLRSGTENVASCVGFAAALKLAQAKRQDETKRLNDLQTLAFQLIGEKLPGATINGSRKHRLPNNIHLTLPGQDNERLLVELDERGILAAAGSACSASDDEPSHVLRAMGLPDADAQASLRITMGRATTESDVRSFVNTLAAVAKKPTL
ncbi:MAG TPA: cysteine desulfurase family protein [Candidatus Saccharimonadales bacterium]|nr:cysteine desulfurase family protein [Candidatus Saccharimonadales bacterium]